MSGQENLYSIATASHLDAATVYSVAWPVSEHVDIAERSGYAGVELWPQRIGPAVQLRFDLLSEREKNGITSVHQSPIGVMRKGIIIPQIQQQILLPGMMSSLDGLNSVYRQAGDIPVVLFNETPRIYMHETGFSDKQIQTQPETAAAWGITGDDARANAIEYVRKAQLNLFNGIVIDTHHIRRINTQTGEKNPLADWRKSIPELLPYTRELHVGIGRTDYSDMAESAKDELDDLLNNGEKNTEVVQMLRFIADKGWKGLVVVEFRPSSIKAEYKRSLLVYPKDLVSAYQRIRKTLMTIFGD